MIANNSVFKDPSSTTSAPHPPTFSLQQLIEAAQKAYGHRDKGTRLPEFLDAFIYSKTGSIQGVYDPMPVAVQYNLDGDLDHNRKYIGTYFPRSFGESREIFSKVVNDDLFADSSSRRSSLRILDIGSGTGGNLCGLLLTLQDKGFTGRVEVVSVDGNDIALDHQRRIIDAIDTKGLSFSLTYTQMSRKFSGDRSVFAAQLQEVMGTGNFDIIMAWKTICEYYKQVSYGDGNNLYATFLDTVSDRLTPRGLCVLLDVCTLGMNMRTWIPIRMADEIRQHIQDSDSCLGIVSPMCCALWGDTCSAGQCYKQRIMTVSHSQKFRDRSKVCYYVFARKSHAETFLKPDMIHEAYGISPARQGKVCKQGCLEEEVGMVAYTTYPNAFVY